MPTYNRKLNEIVSKYNNDVSYESFRDELFELLKEPEYVYRLKGCIIMFRKEHQPIFEKDCEQFIQSCQQIFYDC